MPKVRGNFASKWSRVTPQRSQDFQEGIQNPRRDWEKSTADSAKNWGDGVQKAIQDGRFAAGVREAGDDKWRRKSLEVGVNRFGQGVQAAEDDYRKGFEPFAQTIEATDLPPRFPKGDPRNIERVKVLNQALRNKKVSG